MQIEINDEAALVAWVNAQLAPALRVKGGPLWVALEGTLGAGKTALARALLRALSGSPALDVPSPTYTLLQTYATPDGEAWHFDLYRLQHPDEVFELGWEDTADNFLTLIEWPERLGHLRPKNLITLAIAPVSGSDSKRIITLSGLQI